MKLPTDDPSIAESGLDFAPGEDEGVFTLPAPTDRPDDPPTDVKVLIQDGHLHFFPERSSGQKRVLAALGLG